MIQSGEGAFPLPNERSRARKQRNSLSPGKAPRNRGTGVPPRQHGPHLRPAPSWPGTRATGSAAQRELGTETFKGREEINLRWLSFKAPGPAESVLDQVLAHWLGLVPAGRLKASSGMEELEVGMAAMVTRALLLLPELQNCHSLCLG